MPENAWQGILMLQVEMHGIQKVISPAPDDNKSKLFTGRPCRPASAVSKPWVLWRHAPEQG
jgi:hypothetical protein